MNFPYQYKPVNSPGLYQNYFELLLNNADHPNSYDWSKQYLQYDRGNTVNDEWCRYLFDNGQHLPQMWFDKHTNQIKCRRTRREGQIKSISFYDMIKFKDLMLKQQNQAMIPNMYVIGDKTAISNKLFRNSMLRSNSISPVLADSANSSLNAKMHQHNLRQHLQRNKIKSATAAPFSSKNRFYNEIEGLIFNNKSKENILTQSNNIISRSNCSLELDNESRRVPSLQAYEPGGSYNENSIHCQKQKDINTSTSNTNNTSNKSFRKRKKKKKIIPSKNISKCSIPGLNRQFSIEDINNPNNYNRSRTPQKHRDHRKNTRSRSLTYTSGIVISNQDSENSQKDYLHNLHYNQEPIYAKDTTPLFHRHQNVLRLNKDSLDYNTSHKSPLEAAKSFKSSMFEFNTVKLLNDPDYCNSPITTKLLPEEKAPTSLPKRKYSHIDDNYNNIKLQTLDDQYCKSSESQISTSKKSIKTTIKTVDMVDSNNHCSERDVISSINKKEHEQKSQSSFNIPCQEVTIDQMNKAFGDSWRDKICSTKQAVLNNGSLVKEYIISDPELVNTVRQQLKDFDVNDDKSYTLFNNTVTKCHEPQLTCLDNDNVDLGNTKDKENLKSEFDSNEDVDDVFDHKHFHKFPSSFCWEPGLLSTISECTSMSTTIEYKNDTDLFPPLRYGDEGFPNDTMSRSVESNSEEDNNLYEDGNGE
ncbi:hypothetical protein GJ496_000324 [Pomphorhynchus laevis]|nr:hypothetical protein GJ496_000324 [Pomphorhynchus laevis]